MSVVSGGIVTLTKFFSIIDTTMALSTFYVTAVAVWIISLLFPEFITGGLNSYAEYIYTLSFLVGSIISYSFVSIRKILKEKTSTKFTIFIVVLQFFNAVLMFASVYRGLTFDSIKYHLAQPFSQSVLSIEDAIYFSVTTFTSTGFGDIAPVSVGAKMFTSLQMTIGWIYSTVIMAIFI
ncbi:ion channel [Alicyclobacillus acidoterrestris]|uniref:Ion channel n=1 Tax=Alicyclobacillus acidoterrestris (strain ATCC 49025 / DSM 3922 / CIP 106132 / NCIMB 13137 / GD3B) TaxID=1356854 RepID=A0A9E7CZ05_ALIAG|nr:ion channel [Alicyclobacillus acidoterrestris]UNO48142.1 ion channel [Alicyclobacillus acidoterrestris]